MKAFFKHIAILFLIVLVLSFVLDKAYTAIFKNDNPRNKVQLVANLKNKHIDYIFLGSSRVENHIDCELVEKLTGKSCLNLGLQGGRLKDYEVLAAFLKSNKVTFNKLLVQVDYSYNFDNYSPSFLAQIAPFVNREDFPKDLKEELEEELHTKVPFARYALNDKVIGFREVVSQLIKKKNKIDLENGFVPLEGIGTSISGHFPEEPSYTNQALEAIINANLNEVVLFTAPYCNSSPDRDHFIKALKLKYPKLHNYVDLFDDEEGMSVNCGHLNIRGARRFSEILTNDILLN